MEGLSERVVVVVGRCGWLNECNNEQLLFTIHVGVASTPCTRATKHTHTYTYTHKKMYQSSIRVSVSVRVHMNKLVVYIYLWLDGYVGFKYKLHRGLLELVNPD